MPIVPLLPEDELEAVEAVEIEEVPLEEAPPEELEVAEVLLVEMDDDAELVEAAAPDDAPRVAAPLVLVLVLADELAPVAPALELALEEPRLAAVVTVDPAEVPVRPGSAVPQAIRARAMPMRDERMTTPVGARSLVAPGTSDANRR